ncbi:hypothetical protein [Pseudopelagicola sp. nBUS_19]|uniref:hypothetical protein n=1 Tax=Pseudopelagicola sp. nBUS_19 TaxID=3395316 RepID=UPI003EBCA121
MKLESCRPSQRPLSAGTSAGVGIVVYQIVQVSVGCCLCQIAAMSCDQPDK